MERAKLKNNLLVVEDSSEVRELIDDQLSGLADNVIYAPNGQVAVEIVRCQHVDTILSDIEMPLMSGIELLESLREEDFDTPFILLTGHASKNNAIKALRLGAYDFLEKPWKEQQLAVVVTEALKVGLRLRSIEVELDEICQSINADSDDKIRFKDIKRNILKMRLANERTK